MSTPEVVLPQEVIDDYKFAGFDNQKKPRLDYVKKVFGMTKDQLFKETEQKIWLSAYANNNLRSDYHWHVDACFIACGLHSPGMYQEAYDAAKASCG